MRLVSSSNLLSLLNVGPSGGGTDAGNKALDATFPLIEEATESRLVASSTTDTFRLPMGREDQVLRLSSGFLASAKVTITMEGGTAPIADTLYRVNTQEGTVLMLGKWTYGSSRTKLLTVKFTHGFDETDGELQNVPQSLQMAHTFMAAAAMQLSPAAISKDKAKALGIDASRGFQAMAQQILQGLHRPRGTVLWPIHSKV